ncbi:uncharacterized protein LOC116349715 [Contarinia nasturtii]|uniref:uncharacterized protein LOC116349715 n=1 Tax=Contarinia nasturtii TaxID=265458 RepID=UPI0012D41F97|nr:uncharacterized protein LOC116349715 [Contarinia nasturtii]
MSSLIIKKSYPIQSLCVLNESKCEITMKFAIFLVLAYFSCCYAINETVWGVETQNLLGNKKVEISSSIFQVKEYTFTFPDMPGKFPIYGIKHVDYKSHPVTVKFLKGGLGDYFVTIHIQSQRSHGIKSEFVFFT